MRPTARTMIVITALALVVAACGDDDATTSTAPDTVATVSTDDSAPPSTASTPTSSGVAESGPSVDDLLALYQVTPLRATYRFGDGDDQAEIVLAQDPTATPPVESITITEVGSKIIISEGVTIFCDGASNMCFEVPGASGENLAAGLLGPAGSVFLAAGGGDLAGMEMTEEPITIAGRDGVCFTFLPPVGYTGDTDLFRQCIDDELGFTLLMQTSNTTTDQVETLMELIDFSQPTPEDFEPTGPVTSTP